MDLSSPDIALLGDVVKDADAVLSGLGARAASDVGIVAQGTRAIVQAMQAVGARRLVVVSAAPVSTTPSPLRPNPPRHDPGDTWLTRYLLAPLVKRIFGKVYADLAIMEDVLQESGLDWTVIRPPRLLDRPVSGAYRSTVGKNVPGGLSIARADVAHLMLRVVGQAETFRQTVGVAY
jgi:putative NADH-flavin reductase